MVRVSASLKQANITYQAFFLSFFFSGESVVKLLPTLLWKDQKFSLLTTLILSHSFSCFPHAIWYVISWAESRSSWFLLNTGWSLHVFGPKVNPESSGWRQNYFYSNFGCKFVIWSRLCLVFTSSLPHQPPAPILLTVYRALALVNLASCPICAAHWSPQFWVCNSRSYDLPCLLGWQRWLHPYGSHTICPSHDVTWHSSVELGVCLVSLRWGGSL